MIPSRMAANVLIYTFPFHKKLSKVRLGCEDPLPGTDSGEFTVNFNGSGSNKISKTITVTANTEKGSEVVKITAFVKPDPNKVVPAKS